MGKALIRLIKRIARSVVRWIRGPRLFSGNNGVVTEAAKRSPVSVPPQDITHAALKSRLRAIRDRNEVRHEKRRQRDIDAEKFRAIKERCRRMEENNASGS